MTEDGGRQPQRTRGLIDTSVFIARETGRSDPVLPDVGAVSVVTLAELRVGVLLADDPEALERRLRTLAIVESELEALPVDWDVARIFAELTAGARRAGRRHPVMDTWIAATAIAHHLPLYTEDEDFLAVPRLEVIRA